MSSNLEDWETQQEAEHAAAHKEGPLDFLAGGGTVASRREQEEKRVSDTLAHEAEEHHKKLVEASMKGLHDATFPDEIAHFRDVLLKLDLTPKEQEDLKNCCGKNSDEDGGEYQPEIEVALFALDGCLHHSSTQYTAVIHLWPAL